MVARTDTALFREIVEYSRSRFDIDKASYHISAKLGDVQSAATLSAKDAEDLYLNQAAGRQILHVTFGSVLTVGKTGSGRSFKECVLEALNTHADLHSEVLEKHLGKHIQLLSQG